jgi:hypothetical protein
MKINHIVAAAVIAVGAAGFSASASASEVHIAGSIFWEDGTPTTVFSAADEISNFSFDTNSVLPHTTPGAFETVTNFQYSLNNVAVAVPVNGVTFYDVGSKGLFDINFSAGGNVSLYGANIGNIDSTWVITNPGFYNASAAYNDGAATSIGGVVLTVSAVPLPAALPLFGAALLGLGGLGMRKKSSSKVA